MDFLELTTKSQLTDLELGFSREPPEADRTHKPAISQDSQDRQKMIHRDSSHLRPLE